MFCSLYKTIKNVYMILVLVGYSLRYGFRDVHEPSLRTYLLRVSTFYIGLTLMEIRKLAHEYAVKPEHNIPMRLVEHECK